MSIHHMHIHDPIMCYANVKQDIGVFTTSHLAQLTTSEKCNTHTIPSEEAKQQENKTVCTSIHNIPSN